MADSDSKTGNEEIKASQSISSATPKPKGNPAFRALGLPNFRLRLPSRNWLIFLSVTSSFAGALYYDRRQKRLTQRKWCNLVSHIAHEPLQASSMPRRVTIYLQAPPGDGLRPAREHFTEYVKPILVAAALDWDVIEGRREGDVRVGTADKIRRHRRRQGEDDGFQDDQLDKEELVHRLRGRIGVQEWHDTQGHIVIGRHTWKEYIRGLHEGWLGSLKPPPEKIESQTTPDNEPSPPSEEEPHKPDVPATADPDILITPEAKPLNDPLQEAAGSTNAEGAEPTSTASSEGKKEEKPAQATKPLVPPPHNTPESYSSSSLPRSIPAELPPSGPIPFPHILGFLNTLTRVYRFLTRRHLADEVGRATATAVLASHRPFERLSAAAADDNEFALENTTVASAQSDENQSVSTASSWEQAQELAHEESDWIKKTKERIEGEGERVRLDPIRLDGRIASRMRRFVMPQEEEERAARLWAGTEGPKGQTKESEVD
ncbi:MAG: mitochondrial import inner membrane translocase subunit tim54 [Chrysothrix sp. TS-e1954]|nr:MAG: mitochondrial import inner membrane translocase subunit tim54 [Chrysothrix sp. TS-e1954]